MIYWITFSYFMLFFGPFPLLHLYHIYLFTFRNTQKTQSKMYLAKIKRWYDSLSSCLACAFFAQYVVYHHCKASSVKTSNVCLFVHSTDATLFMGSTGKNVWSILRLCQVSELLHSHAVEPRVTEIRSYRYTLQQILSTTDRTLKNKKSLTLRNPVQPKALALF